MVAGGAGVLTRQVRAIRSPGVRLCGSSAPTPGEEEGGGGEAEEVDKGCWGEDQFKLDKVEREFLDGEKVVPATCTAK